MSEALIVRRGGTGGLSPNNAVIHVKAPIGSSIEFAKGGVTVKTLDSSKGIANADGVFADYYYSISASNYGSWTITARKDGGSVSETITVDDNEQYDTVLTYRVPAEYQAVEYLETASSLCYFDTGVSAVDNNIKVDTHIAVATTTGNPYVFGISKRYAAQVSNQYSQWWFYYYSGENADTVSNKYTKVVGTKYHLIYNATTNGDVILNDETVATGKTRKAPDGYSDTILIAGNRYGHSMDAYGAWRYEDFIVSDNTTGEIYADLRPCYRKADSAIGFWDDVQKVFRTNLGTNPPTVGPDIL